MFSVCLSVPFFLVLLQLVIQLSLSRGQRHSERVLAIGKTNDRLMVITGPLQIAAGYPKLFNVPASALDDEKGQLYLEGKWPIPISDKWNNFSSTIMFTTHGRLTHSITYWDQVTEQLFLMMEFPWRPPFRPYAVVVIGLQGTFLAERPQWFEVFHDDVWISTSEPLTVYLIKNGLKNAMGATAIAKARCEIRTHFDPFHPQILNFTISTHYYTICKSVADPTNLTIFLSDKSGCPNAVHWEITTGFVDSKMIFLIGNGKAYFFEKRLFDKAATEETGDYMSRTIDDFLFIDHTVPTTKKVGYVKLPIVALIPIAVCIVALITVVLFLLYCFCDCGTSANSNLESATSSNAKGDSANTKSVKKDNKKPSPPEKSKKSKQTKKTKKSKKSTSNNKKLRKSSKPLSNKTKKSKKTKKTKKTTKKSAKNPHMDLGSDMLPLDLSQKMPSIKTNDADGNLDELMSEMAKKNKSQKRSTKTKKKSNKTAKSSKKGRSTKKSIKPLMGGKLLKGLNTTKQPPMMGGLMAKMAGKQSFKAGISKKTKASKMPDDGSFGPPPSLPPGMQEDDQGGSMRGDD